MQKRKRFLRSDEGKTLDHRSRNKSALSLRGWPRKIKCEKGLFKGCFLT